MPLIRPSTAIKLILDNHSAHISRETRAWLATRPSGRFEFTFTPKHGSWLNLIEGFFSKFARSVLRHIRVASKHELKERIMAGIDDVNRHPVIHTWSYNVNRPLIAVCCQAYISELAHGTVVVLAPSELVRVAETARARLIRA